MYEKLKYLKSEYEKGVNIITKEDIPLDERIEIAYDFQSGSYIEFFKKNRDIVSNYVSEISAHIESNFPSARSILDCGCGEMTTTSLIFENIPNIERVACFDSSLSRLVVGMDWLRKNGLFSKSYDVFCSNMDMIPLKSNCIDIGFTNHAIESNLGNELKIIKEIHRVSRLGVALAEPSYELCSDSQRGRMYRFNYVRGIVEAMEEVGLVDIKTISIENSINKENATTLHIGFKKYPASDSDEFKFFDFFGGEEMAFDKNYSYLKSSRGVVYPIIEGIPIIKNRYQILATRL